MCHNVSKHVIYQTVPTVSSGFKKIHPVRIVGEASHFIGGEPDIDLQMMQQLWDSRAKILASQMWQPYLMYINTWFYKFKCGLQSHDIFQTYVEDAAPRCGYATS